jgi:5-methylcytosine-specific restriction endonuclease McrA
MSKRAEAALQILLERGMVTTAELNQLGYDHPPRAIGDLKDAGVTIAKTMVTVEGRRMAQYTLVDTVGGSESIRRQLPKKFREQVFSGHSYRCAVCGGRFTSRELQLDHRIPFRIAGDPQELAVEDFMPLCGSDNRGKSWTCENCTNWTAKDPNLCATCYWADPQSYRHIAGVEERRIIIAVRGKGITVVDGIGELAAREGITPGEWVQSRLGYLLDNHTHEDE